ncbi:MAG: TonB-dependent receptor, partial [Pseudomonadota bacterium]
MRSCRFNLVAALGLAIVLLVAVPVVAQSPTTGAIRGVISEQANGAPLAGATIVAVSPVLLGTQAELSDSTGQYYIGNLPPGIYEITVYYSDATVRRQNIIISIGKLTAVNVAVNTGVAKGEVITITERSPMVNIGSATQGITLGKDYITQVPTGGPTFSSLLSAASGSQPDFYGTSFGGATSVENQYIVDGINTTNLTYGRVGSEIVNDFIEETEIISGGYEAEYRGSTGGVVNIATKSGTNELHGSVRAELSPGQLEASREKIPVLGSAIRVDSEKLFQGNLAMQLGGPIVKDKVWFWVGFAPVLERTRHHRIVSAQVDRENNSYKYSEQNRDSDGDPATTIDKDCSAADKTCESDSIPDVDWDTGLTKVEDIESATRNFTGLKQTYNAQAKVTFALDPNHQGAISGLFAPGYEENLAVIPGQGFLPGTDAATHLQREPYVGDLAFKWTSKFAGNKTQIDLVAGWHQARNLDRPLEAKTGDGRVVDELPQNLVILNPVADPAAPYPSLAVIGRNRDQSEHPDVLRLCQDGTPEDPFPGIQNCPIVNYAFDSYGMIIDEREKRQMANLVFTHRFQAAGHHELKAGGGLEANELVSKVGYTGGRINLTSQNAAGNPAWMVQRYVTLDDKGTDVCGRDESGNAVHCAYLDSRTRTSHTPYWSAFLQDKWQILPNLTVNAGLRYDGQTLKYADELQGTIDARTNEEMPEDALTLHSMFAPRVGVLYDWTKEGRSRVYANLARYYETIPLDINKRSFGGETFYQRWFEHSECGAPLVVDGITVFPSEASNCPETTVPAENTSNVIGGTNLVVPGTKPQYVDEAVAGIEYEVFEDLLVGLSYQNRRLGRVIEDLSTDGAATYMIANPGELDEDEESRLEDEIESLAHEIAGLGDSDPAKKEELAAELEGLEVELDMFRKIRGFDKPRRDYHAVTLHANKRMSRNFFLQASYTYSRLEGNYPGLFSPDTNQLDPNVTSMYDLTELVANRDGPLPHDRPHTFKLDGVYGIDLREAGIVRLAG